MLRASDLLALTVADVTGPGGAVVEEITLRQRKTGAAHHRSSCDVIWLAARAAELTAALEGPASALVEIATEDDGRLRVSGTAAFDRLKEQVDQLRTDAASIGADDPLVATIARLTSEVADLEAQIAENAADDAAAEVARQAERATERVREIAGQLERDVTEMGTDRFQRIVDEENQLLEWLEGLREEGADAETVDRAIDLLRERIALRFQAAQRSAPAIRLGEQDVDAITRVDGSA